MIKTIFPFFLFVLGAGYLVYTNWQLLVVAVVWLYAGYLFQKNNKAQK